MFSNIFKIANPKPNPNPNPNPNTNTNCKQWISILIASYNTPENYLNQCLDSIIIQKNDVGIELVWVNDGSNEISTQILERALKNFENKCKQKGKFIKVKYIQMPTNKGLSYCLHHGVLACTYDIIFRMDSDDIMHETRIEKQLDFMNRNPKCILCGTDMITFTMQRGVMHHGERSNHPEYLSWEDYVKTKKFWILNHPTLCFRKYAVISVGNYDENLKNPYEDLDLELRLLKKSGFICNLKEFLLYYRIHENQITWTNRNNSKTNNELKKALIEKIIHS